MPITTRETTVALRPAAVSCYVCVKKHTLEKEVGGVIGLGNTCKSKADSCQCMTKTTTIL